jgi:hypothetical protein
MLETFGPFHVSSRSNDTTRLCFLNASRIVLWIPSLHPCLGITSPALSSVSRPSSSESKPHTLHSLKPEPHPLFRPPSFSVFIIGAAATAVTTSACFICVINRDSHTDILISSRRARIGAPQSTLAAPIPAHDAMIFTPARLRQVVVEAPFVRLLRRSGDGHSWKGDPGF